MDVQETLEYQVHAANPTAMAFPETLEIEARQMANKKHVAYSLILT